jgi:hypothetical protein
MMKKANSSVKFISNFSMKNHNKVAVLKKVISIAVIAICGLFYRFRALPKISLTESLEFPRKFQNIAEVVVFRCHAHTFHDIFTWSRTAGVSAAWIASKQEKLHGNVVEISPSLRSIQISQIGSYN